MANTHLETFRELFKDTRVHMTIGLIETVAVASDRSAVIVLCKLVFENRKISARMTWDNLSNESGVIMLPEINDAVLIAFPDAEDDHALVVKRLTSGEERIPVKAVDGHLVAKAPTGKKAFISSDTKISIAKGDNEGTEPLVLGNVMKAFVDSLIDHLINASNNYRIGFCAVGDVYLDPQTVINLLADKTVYADTAGTNFLSQIAFTERGN